MREAVGQVPPPPSPHVDALTTQRPPKRTGDRDARARSRSPDGSRDKREKFFFKGCWHCGKVFTEKEQRHSRQQCPEFVKILKAANPGVQDRKLMKLPQGYKGAYEKAREKA